MPKFAERNKNTGKKYPSDKIVSIVPFELKKDLELLAKHNKRTLSDFCKLELEKVVENEKNQEILKTIKNGEGI